MPTTAVPSRIHPLSAIDTRTLPPDGGPRYNRLIFEASPYLLQHATNPVDWHPWGDSAFSLARERNVPVFLSIGYATCHWCHVMEHECFEDDDVAALLNQNYVAIKVDREERPDIDQLYMHACQLLTGSGGWPLNLILDPDRNAFFAATYIPKYPRGGGYGLVQLLEQVAVLWREQRPRLDSAGREVLARLRHLNSAAPPVALHEGPLRQALNDFRRSFDPLFGGFGGAPKFPSPHQLILLLRLSQRFHAPEAATMALGTLRAIVRGGIHDQLGGGIHRYSVDARWLVPHFEKMLYDQALSLLAATEAWQATRDPLCAEFAEALCTYLLRDMRDPLGGFYSGEDADSAGTEGSYYLWTDEQIRSHLDPESASLAVQALGVTPEGNFEGQTILTRARELNELTASGASSAAELLAQLQTAKAALLQLRETRVRPLLDDKIICAWNGLTVAALARAGAIFRQAPWLDAARAAAEFINTRLTTGDGKLLRRWRRGQAGVSAYLEDYAAVIWGLTELHQATLEEVWLQRAQQLAARMLERFDDLSGGLYDNADDHELTVRPRNWQDGAFPAGSSLAAYALLRLGRLCGDEALEERGRQVVSRQLGHASSYPSAAALLLTALDVALGPAATVTLALPEGVSAARWLDALQSRWLPQVLLRRAVNSQTKGAGSAQICHDHVCLPAVTDPESLLVKLDELFARR